MESLRVAGFVDELGRGKNLIFSESIKLGKRPPEVHIENAGKYQRWKLILFGGREDPNLIRLLNRCRQSYNDERKALIALALVLWRDRTVSEIRNYVDGDFGRQFVEVLASNEGPIFYWREKDEIVLKRWAKVLIGEGKDSKALSAGEEERLLETAYDIQTKYSNGIITPHDFRGLAGMGNTKSEHVLSSQILARWSERGHIKKIGHGKYEFVKRITAGDLFGDLFDLFDTTK